jgi:hypothetical protein
MGVAHRPADTDKWKKDKNIRIESFLLACNGFERRNDAAEQSVSAGDDGAKLALPRRPMTQTSNTKNCGDEADSQSQEETAVSGSNNIRDAWRHGATEPYE